MTDWAETLEGLAAGDLAATDRIITLVTQYLSYIGAYRYRDVWDDLVQEVLISVLKGPPRSERPGAIVRHIQTTTYRKYIDEIRREHGRRRLRGENGEAQGSGWRLNIALDEVLELCEPEDFWANQMDPGLRKALEGIEERRRRVIEARYLMGFTNEEGSSRLGIPLGTYKRLLAEGLADLRAILLNEGGAA